MFLKLIDRYILKRFLVTFFFVVLLLLAVITVIDLTEKIDKYNKANLTAWEITQYYLAFVPWVGALLMPIMIFIATVYVCSRMAAHTEIIAILSAGVSFLRYSVPYFIGAGIVAVFSFYLNGWIIPDASKSRLAFELQYLKSKYYFDKRNIHMQVAKDTYLYMQSYNNSSNTGYHFTMEKFNNNHLVEKLTAARIEWDSVKTKWKLRDWKIKRIDAVFDPARLSSPEGPAMTVASTAPVEDPALQGTEKDTVLVINPKEFESDYRKYDGMTMGELNDYIRTLRARGSTGVEAYEVEKQARFASPFSIFILVFMGVIVSARKSRGGTGLQIALGFALSFVFLILFVLFRSLADAGDMPPTLSVWIPNILFGVISLIMYKYVPR